MLEAAIGDDHGMSLTQPGLALPHWWRRWARPEQTESEALRGAGGRSAPERCTPPRRRHASAAVRRHRLAGRPVVVLELGGYGRRHLLPGIGHRYPRALRRPHRPVKSVSSRLSASASGIWGLSSAIRCVRSDDFNRMETANTEFLLRAARCAAHAVNATCSHRFGALFHTAATHEYISSRSWN